MVELWGSMSNKIINKPKPIKYYAPSEIMNNQNFNMISSHAKLARSSYYISRAGISLGSDFNRIDYTPRNIYGGKIREK